MGQSGYGSVDGSVVHGDENAQPADHATPEGEEGGPSALGTPAHGLGPSVQTREDSMSQETSQDPVSLPDGVLPARTMGNAADFLGMVQMLQSVMRSSSGNLPEDQTAGSSGIQESFLSALSAERTPQARDATEFGVQPQGTPDFPHRVQEELFPPSQLPAAFAMTVPDLPRGSSGEAQAPLFGQEQLSQWARLEREAPQLYGQAAGQEYFRTAPRSEAPSLSSGDIQAEVRRQLDALRMSHAVQIEALMRENEDLRRQIVVGAHGSQEPRRWGSAAAKVLDWFRGGSTSGSSFVPPVPHPILNSLGNLIPKASMGAQSRPPPAQAVEHLGMTSMHLPVQETSAGFAKNAAP